MTEVVCETHMLLEGSCYLTFFLMQPETGKSDRLYLLTIRISSGVLDMLDELFTTISYFCITGG